MRANPILTLIAIAIASTGTVYYFLRDNASAIRAEGTPSSISSISNLDILDRPIRDSRNDQPANPEQRRLTLLNEKIADLEARLRYMETAASKQAKGQAISVPDKQDANNNGDKGKVKKFSDDDFGHWMDETLDAGHFDRNATKLVMAQAETSLAKVPGINLGEMQCGERFCRATLTPETGKRLDLSQVAGASQFMNSGFTIDEPDGSVRVYFTQPEQSLSELRSEAQNTAFGDIPTE